MYRSIALALALLVLCAGPCCGQPKADAQPSAAATVSTTTEPSPQGELLLPAAARPGPQFDVERATRAYLDSVPAETRMRSDAYFEGGYWLKLWDFVVGLAIAGLLLFGRLSARLRSFAERISRRRWLQMMGYAAGLIVVMTVLALPFSWYEDWYREHQYGLSNLSLGAWLGEWGKSLVLAMLLGAPAVALIYAAVRGRRNWWLPASVLSVLFMLLVNFIAPVFITPVFNRYQPLGPGPVREQVLTLARAQGVAARDVYWFDASKQAKRISANVSGLGHTTRVSLNDNLLRDTSLPEIRAVMAHELGHYVLNHPFKLVLQFGLVLAAGLAVTQWAQRRLVERYGARWGLRGPDDVAGLPLIIALLSIWFFVMTPVSNSIVRAAETEADYFGLNAAREPHGFASAAMRLASYRKLEPSPLEELIFYDHPSGGTRVRTAMTWAAENPDAGAAATPAR